MPERRWQQIKQVFDQAADLVPAERSSFLGEIEAVDPELRREVESLLEVEARPASVFAGPAFEVAAALISEQGEEAVVGRRIGSHRILRRLGEGGMGAVYLAERADEHFQKQVAVKLIKRGMDSEAIVRRFHQERQILASLEHPGIARLLDGGITEEGLSYFVMEYVDGEPITTYCDRRGLSIRARLELFRRVAAAVEHAHRNLVVHCDLKPSNILVTEEGEVRLLDFGVATLLGSAEIPRLGATALGGPRPMTPEYASPEQVLGRTITTASDVYSLGVLLYELLTGCLPHRFESRLRAEIERAVREDEPARPSTVASRIARRSEADARAEAEPMSLRIEKARGGISAARLRRLLEGDLDNIVLMALAKDPARRYGSAEQLSEDLRRHLEGLPVLAAADTLAYRAGKFFRRHRAGVAAAALVALSLVAGILVALWQARKATEAQARADGQAREATEARARADGTLAFVRNLVVQADPRKSGRAGLTLKEILDRSHDRIDGELAEQPGVRAAVLDTMGQVYVSLGVFETAEALLEEGLELRRETFGGRHPETALSRLSLAGLYNALDRYAVAEPLAREALEVLAVPPYRIDATLALATSLRGQGELERAEPIYRRALALAREGFGAESLQVSEARNGLALVRYGRGDFRQAEELIRGAVALRSKLLGAEHPETLESRINLGGILLQRQRFEEAEEVLREVLRVQREVLGRDHPDLVHTLSTLGVALRRRGELAEAEEHYAEALRLARRISSPLVPVIQQSLAVLFYNQERYEEAESLLRLALAGRRRQVGAEHPNVMQILYSLALVRRARDDLAEAEALHRRAVEMARAVLPEGDWQHGRALVGLAQVLVESGRAGEAVGPARRGLEILRAALGEEHYRVGLARSVLGHCLWAEGGHEEAEGHLLAGYELLRASEENLYSVLRDAEERLDAFYRERGGRAAGL